MSVLVPPSPDWPAKARTEMDRWQAACGADLIEIHHIGSTSVNGLPAKPVIDLLPVFVSESVLDAAEADVLALGYEWLGPYGLPGRRYCRLDDDVTGQRRVQAHAYASGSPEIRRHLAFRDWLRASPENAGAYAAEKKRCAGLFPEGGPSYQDCKSAWIDTAEATALEAMP